MNDPLFSTYWYRVAGLKPMVRNAVSITRHVYRGQPWFVLSNRLNGSNHRFNAPAYAVIGQMDGRRTVQEILENAQQSVGDDAPSQDEVIRLLGQLHDADLVQSDILPSTLEIVRQLQTTPGNGWKQRAANPFAMRFPLINPERLLKKWGPLSAPFFTRTAFIIWLAVICWAVVSACLNWPELTGRLSDQLMSPQNLVVLWLVYPIVKLFHELGHALAVKHWGGEVHEMGITLLALTPIPYVDATASAAFADKRQRMAVAAMGMAAELLLASMALFVWLNVEPGVVSAVAYNVMLIAGVSTVVFNGNPLLRYDGYYILADLIEVPNLSQRSVRYLGYLVKQYLFGMASATSPVTAPGESGWFLFYGPAAFCYRIIVLIGLVWLVSGRFFVVGIVVAIWGICTLMILPASRTLLRLLNSPAARQRRARLAATVSGLCLALVLLLLFPFPLWTTTQGVVWLPEQSAIRAGTDCEVMEILSPADQSVDKDTPLIRGADAFLEAQITIHRSELDELYATYNALPLYNRVERRVLMEDIEVVKGNLRHAEAQQSELLIRSPARGRFILIDSVHLPGRFVRKGELLGYILSEQRPTVRAVVSQNDIGLVRERTTRVMVRLAERLENIWSADVHRVAPGADLALPSAALGIQGGGDILMDPTDPEGLRALNSYFQMDLRLPDQVNYPFIGSRVHVRLDHGTMPLAMQWYRKLRQLFMRKFYV